MKRIISYFVVMVLLKNQETNQIASLGYLTPGVIVLVIVVLLVELLTVNFVLIIKMVLPFLDLQLDYFYLVVVVVVGFLLVVHIIG